MNIVIPTADYPPIEGGIGTVSLHLSRELAEMGHNVTVIAPYFPGMDDFDATEPANVVRFHGYHVGWFRFFPMLLKSWGPMRRADLVMGINIAYGGIMAWLARRPYVTFAYAYEFLKFRHVPLIPTLFRRVYNHACAVIAISHYTAEQLRLFGVDAAQIRVVFPGAPAPEAVSDNTLHQVREKLVLDGSPLILAVGRMIPRKGHAKLVRALAAIRNHHPAALLVCVGQGPTVVDVAREAQRLNLRDAVRLPGRLSDTEVAALYRLCDVFALPTGEDQRGQVEGFGLVFSEAHAYGMPVVAGRSGGVVDAVLHEETGLLVDPEDEDALADSLLRLLNDEEEAARLGAAGKERVERELNWAAFTRGVMDGVEGDHE
jgi:phosphatidyl-myo-inositol dimannoside synthase